MATYKVVNGQRVLMTPAEEADFLASRAIVEAGPRRVSKSVITARLIEAGKIDAAYEILAQNPSQFARWFSPDAPDIAADDPEARALLAAIGLDPDVILT